MMPDSTSLLHATLRWAQRIRECGLRWKSGIYPAEMAVFFGVCETTNVGSIGESGRGPDAYSTHLLGMYGDMMSIPVISTDFSPIDDHYFSEKLRSYSSLTCVNGDAFTTLPRAFAGLPGPHGLIIDGPKFFTANTLSFSLASAFPVRCIAHHNTVPETPWWKEFQAAFPTSFHYENLPLATHPDWQAFRQWEHEETGGYEMEDKKHGVLGRSLEQSSLGMAVVGPADGARVIARLPSWQRRLRVRAQKWRWMLSGFMKNTSPTARIS